MISATAVLAHSRRGCVVLVSTPSAWLLAKRHREIVARDARNIVLRTWILVPNTQVSLSFM